MKLHAALRGVTPLLLAIAKFFFWAEHDVAVETEDFDNET
jgi:hypothetical protein